MRSDALAKNIAQLTLTKKAHDVVIMNLRGLTSMADFFVVCSADSDVQMKAIADGVQEGMEKKRSVPWHVEAGSSHWILLDYVDVVLHIFHKNTRPFYNLEKLWGDATIKSVSDRVPALVKRTRRAKPGTRKTTARRKKAS